MGRKKIVGGPEGIDPNDQGVKIHPAISPLQFRNVLSWQRASNDAAMGTLSWMQGSNVDRRSAAR